MSDTSANYVLHVINETGYEIKPLDSRREVDDYMESLPLSTKSVYIYLKNSSRSQPDHYALRASAKRTCRFENNDELKWEFSYVH